MGEGPIGGAFGRRRAHPHDAVSGPGEPDTEVAALLGAALRGDGVDAEAEKRAVTSFLAARDAGAHRAPTRRRDDWRPRRRPPARTLRTTLAVLLGSLTAGGVAFATIGSPSSSPSPSSPSSSKAAEAGPGGRTTPPPAASAPGAPTAPAPSRATSTAPDRPAVAQDTEAHCRAYGLLADGGKALDAAAWQRLVAAAGGEERVEAYCAEQLTPAAEETPGDADRRPTGDPGSKGRAE
ncbi:hypothetical protein [Streptomyces chromofuscus]|uniref:Uncharacterized protein n=1 Tax=Streptomyces chromofuscus TaxID=42881 RepID=A0A7M2T501_STRCW|nr:hypothetical protein [Streptomyces chromofuscus]QOV42561.1 hypothetical protein IPT68_22395 [Streptomyces chromofuscus]GGT30540.1 hypothetical protein GCM10010254_58850 [Streptomyces chromofuscus]